MTYRFPCLVLYEYTNREFDIVKNAFRSGNYQSIRDLPNELNATTISQSVKERVMNAQLYSSIQTQNLRIAQEILKENGGTFKKFEWMPDEYERKQMTELNEKIASLEKIKQMHEVDFNPAKVKKNAKYDNPFLGKGEKLTYSFLGDGDPYE